MRKRLVFLFGVAALAGCAVGPKTAQTSHSKPTQTCEPIDAVAVAGLFERWNTSLQTGSPKAVVENYADHSILLPTLSGVNRLTKQEKEDYFTHFLAAKPVGTVRVRQIDIGCNMASDSGMYTFLMGINGEKVDARYTFTYKWTGQDWLISSHHSSVLPSNH